MDYACVEFQATAGRYVEYSTHSILTTWIPIFCAWSAVLDPQTVQTTQTIYADQFTTTASSTTSPRLEYGNIASFLDQDPYYAETGIGSRYTSVHPFTAVLDEQNCFAVNGTSNAEKGVNIQVPINETAAPTGQIGFTMFFIDTAGRVRGPKSGTMCEYIPTPDPAPTCTAPESKTRYGTCLANTTTECPDKAMLVGHTICRSGKLTSADACTTINNMLNRYDTATEPEQKVSPGNLKWFLEDLLQNRVQDSTGNWDMETFVQRNRTAYASATSDPRDAADGTRSTGILPKCSAPTCYADQFTGSQSKAPQVLHDLMFQVNKIREIVAQYQCQ